MVPENRNPPWKNSGPGQRLLGDFAPKMVKLTDDVLFGDVWKHIGQLSTRSDQFRVRWGAHNVQIHTTGVKLIHHPVVGDLDLPFESFPIPAEPSQSLLTCTTEPGSPSHDALSLLASWTTSPAHDTGQQAPQQDPGHDTRSGSASRLGET